MHDEVIKHSLVGEVADGNVVEHRERLIHFLETKMREEGCVPNLDLDPQFTLDYRPETGTFNYALSVYSTYVGGENSWNVAGTTSGKTIMKYTAQSKSKESSPIAE